MSKYDLSVLIPARNEEFLALTVEGVLQMKRGKTEVIAVLDGEWADPPVAGHPDLTLVHHAESIGQRAAINEAARISKARFVMKLDAHCRVAEGFDVELMKDCEYDWTVVPRQFNLHAFDWKCLACGNRTYQGPKPTVCNLPDCSGAEFERVMVWEPRWSRRLDSMRFDNNLHYQSWGAFTLRPEGDPSLPIAETMSLLGACFFMHRERYWELGGSDEATGSWGQQGTEISLKSWLSGGKVISNRRTWYSHLFRTQSGFQFPWPCTHAQTEHARQYSKSIWLNNAWPQQVRPLSWVLEHFWPIPDWSNEDLAQLKEREKDFRPASVSVSVPETDWRSFATQEGFGGVGSHYTVSERADQQYAAGAPDTGLSKGVVFYTENRCPEPVFSTVTEQLKRSLNGHQLVSVSLQPIDFGENFVLNLERGYLTMFQQILMGLSQLDTDIAFLAEHDVLYPKSYFDYTPPRNDQYYFNLNCWKLFAPDGFALHYRAQQTSQLVANRRLLIDHYRERIARVEKEGFSRTMGFEPGKPRARGGVDDVPAVDFWSPVPTIDIRHTTNLTANRRRRDQFRNQKFCQGWTEGDRVPGWPGVTLGRFDDFLADVRQGVVP